MRNTTKRAYVLFALIALFFIGFAILAVRFGMNGEKWATDSHNKDLQSKPISTIKTDGVIKDRNGTVLFQAENGKQTWSNDEQTRIATLHVVGDGGNIGRSILGIVQNRSIDVSYDYNALKGLQTEYVTEDVQELPSDLTLTIDADLCKIAYQTITSKESYQGARRYNKSDRGTVAVYNYKTGDVYCLVSAPSFDPTGNKPADIQDGTRGYYHNRFFYDCYTPGSTFKIVTLISALENIPDITTRTFQCGAGYVVGRDKISCRYDGTVNLEKALNKSCNTTFATIAVELGAQKLTTTVRQLGFFNPVSVNGINNTKSKFTLKDAAKISVGWAGIGQYETRVNPCQMLMLAGAIANNGKAIIPNLIDSDDARGKVNKNIHLDANIAQQVQYYMRSNVKNEYGESTYFKDMEFCAKTGTAETGINGTSHAWFYGFSLREDFPVAIVVCLEEGGSGFRSCKINLFR